MNDIKTRPINYLDASSIGTRQSVHLDAAKHLTKVKQDQVHIKMQQRKINSFLKRCLNIFVCVDKRLRI